MNDLEKKVHQAIEESINSALSERLSKYGSPLTPIIDAVVEEKKDAIATMLNSAFSKTLESSSFQKLVLEEFHRKVAKMLISKLEGSVEKAVNDIRQTPSLRAKLILAVESFIDGAVNQTQ